MKEYLSFKKANIDDLQQIIALYLQDEPSVIQTRSKQQQQENYIAILNQINSDENQYLMAACLGEKIVAACHLIIMPSLKEGGIFKLQIEGVRVDINFKGRLIGEAMIEEAIRYAKLKSIALIQLNTNKMRSEAKRLHEKLGFEVTHFGMKLRLDNQ